MRVSSILRKIRIFWLCRIYSQGINRRGPSSGNDLMHKISLRNDNYAVEILPALGGAIASFRAISSSGEELDLLAPAADAPDIARKRFAAQPRLPFATEAAIGDSPENFATTPWTVQDASDVRATLTCYFSSTTAQPWEFQLLQRIIIEAEGLQIYLTLTNIGKQPIPAQLGVALRLPQQATVCIGDPPDTPITLPGWADIAMADYHAIASWPSCPCHLAIDTDASLSTLWLEAADSPPTPAINTQNPAPPADPALLTQTDSCAGQLQLSARFRPTDI